MFTIKRWYTIDFVVHTPEMIRIDIIVCVIDSVTRWFGRSDRASVGQFVTISSKGGRLNFLASFGVLRLFINLFFLLQFLSIYLFYLCRDKGFLVRFPTCSNYSRLSCDINFHFYSQVHTNILTHTHTRPHILIIVLKYSLN